MRVLHCIHSLNPEGGGPIRFVRQMAERQDELGIEVVVASVDGIDNPLVGRFPCPVHALGPGRGSWGYSGKFVPWLKEHRHEFDLVVVNGLWQFPSLATWLALGKGQTPYVVFPHGMLDPWFNQAYPLKHLKKLLYWTLAEYRVLREARAVLFAADEERLAARTSFSPYRVKEMVVGFGVEEPPGDPGEQQKEFLARFPELEDRQALLFLGRLTEKKGDRKSVV